MTFRLQCLAEDERQQTREAAPVATATPATTATDQQKTPQGVANVAAVAVAAGRPLLGVVRCRSCRHFTARPDQRPNGWCAKYNADTWAGVPFICLGYEPVSAVVAVRHGGDIVSDEVLVPREWWDVAAFIACLEA